MNKQRLSNLARMTLIAFCASCAFLVSPVFAGPAAAVVGDWRGALATGGGSLHVVLHISQDSNGHLKGTLDSPDQGAAGIEITSISFTPPALHFEIQRFASKFEGEINNGNSEIAGHWKQGNASLPLIFKRSGK